MKRAFYFLALLCMPPAMISAATNSHILDSANLDMPSMQMFGSSQSGTDLGFRLAGIETEEVELDGRTYQSVIPMALDIEMYGETAEEGLPDLPVYAHLIGVPDQSGVRVEIVSSAFEIVEGYNIMPTQTPTLEGSNEVLPFVIDENFYNRDEFYPSEVVRLGEPIICRDLRMIQVVISPVQYNPVTKQLRVYTSIDYNLVYDGFDDRNAKTRRSNRVSESFLPLYRALVPNADELLAAYEPVRGGYLILTPDAFEDTMAVLGRWKHLKGYDVVIATASDIDPNGSSPDCGEVKSYIQNAYDTWEIPPEFVCIIGDISTGIPDYPYGGYTSDHKYSLVDGSDYLSDIMVTRMSVTNWTNLRVAMYKAIKYEKEPYMGDAFYWLRGLSVAGNAYAITPRITVLWVRHQLLNHGFSQVDTVFAWQGIPDHPNVNPGAAPILASMNNGVSMVSYRGYASPSGWYYPSFSTSNLDQVQNNNKIGVMASIVCGTGAYDYPECFGEKWIRMGASPTSFKGGPGFYGTTNLGTHTKWNNPILIGYCWGFLEEDIYNFASAAFRGKLHQYNTFPSHNSPGGRIEEYHHTYNTLGEPEFEIRTAIPRSMTVTYLSTIPVGTNMMQVHVAGSGGLPLEGAYVNLLKGYGANEEVFVGGRTDSNGDITLDFATSMEDTMFVTVTARNYIPHTGYSLVQIQSVAVGISAIVLDDDNSGNSSGNNDGNVNPSETVEFAITLRNFGNSTTATNVQATLTSSSDLVNITVPDQSYGNIAPGYTANSGKFAAEFVNNIPQGEHIILELEITSDQGSWTAAVPVDIKSMYFLHLESAFPGNPNNRLDPGETSGFVITLQNLGELAGSSLTGDLTTSDPGITIIDGSADFGDIGIGETGSNDSSPFTVEVAHDVYNGHNVNFDLELTSSNGSVASRVISVVIGNVTTFDPVGPDDYGYYMYDDTDVGYDPAPLYDWEEISPYASPPGPGTRINFPHNTDDDAAVISLPFDFVYYGQSFDYMLVCTNGFVAFDTSTYDMGGNRWSNSHNMHIPELGAPRGLIAPYWDDLEYSGNNGVFQYRDTDNHRLIIEWKNCTHARTGSYQSFQMIIYDPDYYPTPTGDSEILFQYQTVNNDDDDSDSQRPGLYCTVGFQNLENSDGLQYTFDNHYHPGAAILQAERAIKVTTVAGVAPPPDIEYDPSSFFASAQVGQTTTDTLHISNVGEGTLIFSLVEVADDRLLVDVYPGNDATSVTPIGYSEMPDNKEGDRIQPIYPPLITGSGGPDNFGHMWIDSDEPGGPTFDWVDISGIGTEVYPGEDSWVGPISVGFSFPFYENSYSSIYINSNGFLSFGSGSGEYNNAPIPSTGSPNNIIAMYWDDLSPQYGSVYYYRDVLNGRFIVSFNEVENWSYGGSLTFEAILYPSGQIMYQYDVMDPGNDNLYENTVGIENATGTDGLQIVYNGVYIHNYLAVRITTPATWLHSDIHGGVLQASEDTLAVITFDATELEEGVYTGAIEITCNDPAESFISIPVTFNVGDQGCVYTPGDCDYNGTPLELGDVIAMIGTYRGSLAPPYECSCPPHGSNFTPTADPNGNCVANELSDVVTEIGAYRGTAEASGCADCPGDRRLGHKDEDERLMVTPLKSKLSTGRGRAID